MDIEGLEEGAKKPLLHVKEIKLDNSDIHGSQGSSTTSTTVYDSSDSSSSLVTFFVVFSVVVLSCGYFGVGNFIGYTSPVESGIMNELGLTLAEYSIFVSIAVIGTTFGAIWSGKVADVIGRRAAMGVSNLISITGWLAIAFAEGPWCLYVGRFLLGFGIGLVSFAGPVYISEIAPKNVRGTFMSIGPLLLSCGKAFFFVIGPLLNWRTLALIGIVPLLLPILGFLLIPESPRWLMKIGKTEESREALQRLRGNKTNISQEIAEIKDYIEYSNRISGNGILSLFQWKYANTLIIGNGLMVFPQLGGLNAIGSYTSSIFESVGFSSTMGSIAVGIIQMLSAVVNVCFIDKLGRRPLLLASSAGACLGFFLIGFSFFLQYFHYAEELTPFLGLIGVLVCLGFIGLSEAVPGIVSLEIFPLNIKGIAGSFLLVVGSICGWINSYSFNFIFEWSSAGTFVIFACITGASGLFIWKMVPETKGRSLEELQASITHDHSLQ